MCVMILEWLVGGLFYGCRVVCPCVRYSLSEVNMTFTQLSVCMYVRSRVATAFAFRSTGILEDTQVVR